MTELIIDNIVKSLKTACEAYYNDEPTMTDGEFDQLRDKLEELDPQNKFLLQIGAPRPSTGWPTHKHKNLMGSLDKVNTKEDFFKWAEDKGTQFLISEKYDGSTVAATYRNGKLETLATRGDGTEGEDITPNAENFQNLPQQFTDSVGGGKLSDFNCEIRGEAILKISLFEKYFRPEGHSNPRNTANGKVRDMKENPLKQHIEVRWFDIHPYDRDIKTESEKWILLGHLGLLDPKYGDPNQGMQIVTAEKAWEIFEQYRDPDAITKTSIRSRLDHEIDGLVVKVNDIDLQESFGMKNGNKPKGAVAIKFPALAKESEVLDIVWSRGLTGSFCPVAHLKPIEVGGVTIAKASLCGIEEIQRLNVAVGDKVLVSRRNDVIPKIERVISRVAGRPDHSPPSKCDICSEELVKDGAYILCLNEECQGELYGNIMTWIKEFKIKGFGPSMVRALITEDVKTVSDLYKASVDIFHRAAGSEKNGDRRYETLHDIGTNNAVRLSTFLSALNIKALGTTNGQRLEKKFKSLDGVLGATSDEFAEIDGIKTNAVKIHKGLQKSNDLITALSGLIKIKKLDESGPLAGKSFCITGDLSVPRPKIQDWIKDLGGEVKSGVSKTLNYLITSDPDSGTGKNKKADKYGVSKLTEDGLYILAGSKP